MSELKHYIGSKSIQARAMTRGEYCKYRGWVIAEGENPDADGYMVVYQDSYLSWSPKQAFESAYIELISPGGDRLTPDDVTNFISEWSVIHQTERMTVCKFVLANGYEFVESSSCVSPENYSVEIGQANCYKQAVDRVWGLLGFLLRTAKYGIS